MQLPRISWEFDSAKTLGLASQPTGNYIFCSSLPKPHMIFRYFYSAKTGQIWAGSYQFSCRLGWNAVESQLFQPPRQNAGISIPAYALRA